MVFQPPRTLGLSVGAAALAALLGLDLFLLTTARGAPLLAAVGLLVSLPFLAGLVYGLHGLLRSRYVLSRNALVVEWGLRREVIPLQQLSQARVGADLPAGLRRASAWGPRGLLWPGRVVGRSDVEGLGTVEFLASTGPAGWVLLRGPLGWLALSPPDPAGFLAAFAACQAEGPTAEIEPESRTPAFAAWSLWPDRLALGLLGAGGAAVLALAVYLAVLLPLLPHLIALRFDAQGRAIHFGPPAELLGLLLLAGLAWGLNTTLGASLHARPALRPGAYLLCAAAALVPTLAWVALFGLLTAG